MPLPGFAIVPAELELDSIALVLFSLTHYLVEMRHKKTKGDGKPSRSRRITPLPLKDLGAEPITPLKTTAVMDGFCKIWESLFTSPIHLDSALSKQPIKLKSILAQLVPAILLRPCSLAEVLGVGIPPGEPWNLSLEMRAKWRPAMLMAERLYENMASSLPQVLPVREDFPPHMIGEWEASWGSVTTQRLVEALAREAPLGLRVNHRVAVKDLLKILTQEAKLPVRAELSSVSPVGIRLSGYAPILKLDLYQQGAFEIQDEGSQLMSLFALWPEYFGVCLQKHPCENPAKPSPALSVPSDIKPWIVVDGCAGAGGKSLAMADLLKGRGRVFAYDTSVKKLQALRRRATRSQLNNIQTLNVEENRELEKIERFSGSADRVLVDAPCSGWGVLRRNPDIKWRQSAETTARMPGIQLRLLSLYSRLVAPGGQLTYGVCTLRKQETVDVVDRFSRENPEFKVGQGGYLGPNSSDGFFMQTWTKREISG